MSLGCKLCWFKVLQRVCSCHWMSHSHIEHFHSLLLAWVILWRVALGLWWLRSIRGWLLKSLLGSVWLWNKLLIRATSAWWHHVELLLLNVIACIFLMRPIYTRQKLLLLLRIRSCVGRALRHHILWLSIGVYFSLLAIWNGVSSVREGNG